MFVSMSVSFHFSKMTGPVLETHHITPFCFQLSRLEIWKHRPPGTVGSPCSFWQVTEAMFLKTHMCVIDAFIFRNHTLIFKQGVKVTHVFSATIQMILTRSLREVFWLNQTQLLRTQLHEPEVCQQSTYALVKSGYC